MENRNILKGFLWVIIFWRNWKRRLGYLPASMEITVEETGNLQSFVLKDDHTKLEVFKLERNVSGEKEPLSWPAAAEFVLCEAVLDENGEQRRKTALICTGKTESWTVGRRMICRNMFRRFQRRMKRCLDSMEMNSGVLVEKGTSGKSHFRRCQTSGGYGDGKQKNHHTDLGIIGWKQNAGLSHS